MCHAAIIGNGIAGITAARRLRALRPDWRISVISGESRYHYSRPALMYIFMGHMRYADTKPFEDRVWADERIELVRDWVTEIDVAASRLRLHAGGTLAYDKLLIATGSQSNRFGWPGQDLRRVQGLYDLIDLHTLTENMRDTRRSVIVGGGLIGVELAEMLHSRGVHVTMLIRETDYWRNVLPAEESAMVSRLIRHEGFDLRLETRLAEILDDGTGAAWAVVTDRGERIEAQLVGLTVGVSPNIDLVRDTAIKAGRGVLVDESLRTNVDNIWAAGDCAEIVRPHVERNLLQQVWYTGKAQGRVAGEAMAGVETRYEPGIWYNSAKFLDLEYQTYGDVRPNPRDGERHLWWEHADGRKGVRLVCDSAGVFIGLNTMGVRYRHEVCEGWIRDRRSIDDVVAQLPQANFDSEFSRRYESEIAATMREQTR